MPKTYGLVKVPLELEINDLSDFLRLVFPVKPYYCYIASKLVSMIAKGEVSRRTWRDVVNKLGVNKRTYYYVLKRLRALGLVYLESETGIYRTSNLFSENLGKIANFWEEWSRLLGEEGSDGTM